MWKIHRKTSALALFAGVATIAVPGAAHAQYVNSDNRSYGMYLPAPVQPSGHDEVRAADGTTCRSAVAGNGPVLDVGGIGAQGRNGRRVDGTIYGRIVVPLGRKPKRLDCSTLYQLEIERLRHELRLARSGRGVAVPAGSGSDFSEGWTEGVD